MIWISHQIPRADVLLGLVRAEPIDVQRHPAGFVERLEILIERRREELTEEEERRRTAARDVLRNGSYKPTGRSKPASEYLLRSVQPDGSGFPRINAPVDVCNFVSLKYVLPISIWDLDRAASERYVYRLGTDGESYAFNDTGQEIDLKDLVIGCRVRGDDESPAGEPIVNPVKDSMLTKTNPETRRVAACIYAPSEAVPTDLLESVCSEFAGLLEGCGADATTAFGVLRSESTIDL